MDFDRIAALLHVAEKSLGFPRLKAIHDAAVAELEMHAKGENPEQEHHGEDDDDA